MIAGIIAVIALVAIVCELLFGGISTVTVAAAVKDCAGIAVDIMVFFVAFKALVKKNGGIRGKIESAMAEIEESYSPLIKEHIAKDTNEKDVLKNEEYIRYDLAKNISALYGEECNDYMRFFEIKAVEPSKIDFFARKKFFGENFDPKSIAEHVKGFCDKKADNYETTYSLDKDGAKITVDFKRTLKNAEDIKSLVSVIDDVLFLFIAENKK